MAVDYMNDSYDRCLNALRDRYKGRGIYENVKNEATLQVKNEAATRAIAPGAYVLFDSKSKIADVYRSGEYNGSKYMTSDDFVRYFKSRRDYYSPKLTEETQREAEVNGAAIRRNGAASSRGLQKGESGGKEGHLANILSAVKIFREKWFPVERKEGRTQVGTFRLPAAALSGIAVFTVSMGLIVSGSVMLGSASGSVGRMKSEVAQLEARHSELQSQLDRKYNIDEIEKEATLLGMVKRQTVDNEYINANGEEQIIVYEDGEDEKVGFSALLAAFGIELD